jgi:hypothetical protein
MTLPAGPGGPSLFSPLASSQAVALAVASLSRVAIVRVLPPPSPPILAKWHTLGFISKT